MRDSRPHPLCPSCGYDLVGTVAARRRTCPECGNEFDPADLGRQRRGDDWTPLKGARRAALTLLWRSFLCGAVCAGLDWLITPTMPSPSYWRVALLLAVAGIVLGWFLTFDLAWQAGFDNPLLVVLAIGFAWAAVIGGIALSSAAWSRPPPDWPAALTLLTPAVFATLTIIRANV